MLKKDIKLFDKAIHQVKNIVTEIKKERDTHNIKLNKLIAEAMLVTQELYELFDNITNKKG